MVIRKKQHRWIGTQNGRAEEYVFGYSIFNDLSSRDLQTRHGQWLIAELSKGITLEAGDIIATSTPVVTVFDEKEKEVVQILWEAKHRIEAHFQVYGVNFGN